MKRILLFTSLFITYLGLVRAQGEMDAYRLSQKDLTGTARSVGMGGAFGALGGDITGISINPAGIGVFKSLEIVTTLNFQKSTIKSDFFGAKEDKDKFKLYFDNMAFATALPLNSDEVPFLNVGFSYNRVKSFDRKYKVRGDNFGSSLTDYMGQMARGTNFEELDPDRERDWYKGHWLGMLGYHNFLINREEGNKEEYDYISSLRKPNASNKAPLSDRIGIDNTLNIREKGTISTYDFNIGTTISDIISLGMTISVTDLYYEINADYEEKYFDHANPDKYFGSGFQLSNWMKTDGNGWQVSLGTIIKPINELRIGIAYHSPIWYDMEDRYSVTIDQNLVNIKEIPGVNLDNTYKDSRMYSPEGYYKYKMRTPDRWTFSMAGVFSNIGILSVDYELTDYKHNMRMKDRGGYYDIEKMGTNKYIKNDFRMASTLRLGTEIRFTNQFSARVGYAWIQSPLDKNFKDNKYEVQISGTQPSYILDGDINNYTWGLGYRFTKNFYMDLAFIYKTQKSNLYMYPSLEETDYYGNEIFSERTKIKNNTMQGLLTFGIRY